ncbi:antibiotic biosynthesis monooxygenase [Nostoc sp. 3335mG]|nr:antibiotic biosynthesis monooxygenase [Nostoc sp. 3335mG]
MTFVRHYLMKAKEGLQNELQSALAELAAKVSVCAGSEQVMLFSDSRDPQSFIFMEYWTSPDAHKAAGAEVGKEALADVMAALGQPPEGRSLDFLATN